MILPEPTVTLVGNPHITVLNSDGSEQKLECFNSLLKPSLDKLFARTLILNQNSFIIKVGSGQAANDTTTSKIQLPIRPNGSGKYNTGLTTTSKIGPVTYSPDGKSATRIVTYSVTWNTDAILGNVWEVGLDLVFATNDEQVTFRAVLDEPAVLATGSQLKVDYNFIVTFTKADPITVVADFDGTPTNIEITTQWGYVAATSQWYPPELLQLPADMIVGPTVNAEFVAIANQVAASYSYRSYSFDTVNQLVTTKWSLPASDANPVGGSIATMAFGTSYAVVRYLFNPPIPKNSSTGLEITFVKDYKPLNPWHS